MFTGIDEVDWASMRHAYGSAEDVPLLLEGLASADAAERETALDGMYGAVHHQGNVYDSTLACVPFLFALAVREEVPDRAGIVDLLVSIGGEEPAGDGGPDDDATNGDATDGDEPDRLRARARAAVRAKGEVFAGLTADPDPAVRRAAAGAAVRFLEQPGRVLSLLRMRLADERDERVLLALIEGLGRFARRHPAHAGAAVELLAAHSVPPHGPGLRLAALGQLAGCAPERLPAELVPTVLRLLRERARLRPVLPDEPDGPDTDTLVGRLRRLRPSWERRSPVRARHRLSSCCGPTAVRASPTRRPTPPGAAPPAVCVPRGRPRPVSVRRPRQPSHRPGLPGTWPRRRWWAGSPAGPRGPSRR
ncbi:hypothetical protein GCM10009535_01610 [Streptomyces thermocarboxydovorans]|uniref:Uncharacterized protein n=1 Tax=Streptomyces thermocarboxydovorans TaxID=59298 RepID=A0ABN1H613_9ACTN